MAHDKLDDLSLTQSHGSKHILEANLLKVLVCILLHLLKPLSLTFDTLFFLFEPINQSLNAVMSALVLSLDLELLALLTVHQEVVTRLVMKRHELPQDVLVTVLTLDLHLGTDVLVRLSFSPLMLLETESTSDQEIRAFQSAVSIEELPSDQLVTEATVSFSLWALLDVLFSFANRVDQGATFVWAQSGLLEALVGVDFVLLVSHDFLMLVAVLILALHLNLQSQLLGESIDTVKGRLLSALRALLEVPLESIAEVWQHGEAFVAYDCRTTLVADPGIYSKQVADKTLEMSRSLTILINRIGEEIVPLL